MAYNETYEEFTQKFIRKKTTDDCYTPEIIYNVVKDFAIEEYNLQDYEIIRPFYPDKEYRDFTYLKNHVVIDNPPFSILSKIIEYYLERDIKFFLFAPSLTCFSMNRKGLSYIIVDAAITYENGAIVKTDFITNLDKYKIKTSKKLKRKLKEVQKTDEKQKPKYEYPKNVLTTSILHQYIKRAEEDIFIKEDEVYLIRALDEQRANKKSIFGAGFLLSDRKADHIQNIKEKKIVSIDEYEGNNNIIKFELSEREKEIIKTLNKADE